MKVDLFPTWHCGNFINEIIQMPLYWCEKRILGRSVDRSISAQMTWCFPTMLCCGQSTVRCKKAAVPSASTGTQTWLHISTSYTSTSVFSKHYFNKGCKQWGILFAAYGYIGDILPPSSGLKTEAVRPLTCWYTANTLLHIALMQKTKYGVNPNSTVCDIVVIVIAVLDPFCIQKELKVFRWDGGGGLHLHGPATDFTEINQLVCKILISI